MARQSWGSRTAGVTGPRGGRAPAGPAALGPLWTHFVKPSCPQACGLQASQELSAPPRPFRGTGWGSMGPSLPPARDWGRGPLRPSGSAAAEHRHLFKDPPQLSDAQTQGREGPGRLEQRPQHTGSAGRASTQTHRAGGTLKAFTVTPQAPGRPGLCSTDGQPHAGQVTGSTDGQPHPGQVSAPPTPAGSFPKADAQWPRPGRPAGSPASDPRPGGRRCAAPAPEVACPPPLAASEADSLHRWGARCWPGVGGPLLGL